MNIKKKAFYLQQIGGENKKFLTDIEKKNLYKNWQHYNPEEYNDKDKNFINKYN
jgi:hypothetical protein